MDRLTSTIPHQIPLLKKGSLRDLLFEKMLVFSLLLSSSKYVVGVKTTVRLFVASVSKQKPSAKHKPSAKQKPSARLTAMAEMVVRSA